MFTTGSCVGHNELFDKLVEWLVGTVGWSQLVLEDSTETRRAIVRAPGAMAGAEFYLALTTAQDVGNNSYGMRMNSFLDYEPSVPVSGQPLLSPPVWFNTWQNAISYWFYASGRRVIVVAKVNTSYVSMYAGLFLPFALPSEFPRPFAVIGNYPVLAPYNVANTRNRMIADPGQGAAKFLNKAQNEWRDFGNHANGTTDINPIANPSGLVWPARQLGTDPGGPTGTSWNSFGVANLRPNLEGEAPSIACHIFDVTNSVVLGVIDGVYHSAGFGKTSEQEIEVGGKTYRAFQNVMRTTERDYMTILEN